MENPGICSPCSNTTSSGGTSPTIPLTGWLFLDRYPAIQQSLREICRRPGRLPGVTRILRRLALAVRLQCRPWLHARLEQWVAADALGESLEAVSAFGVLGGWAVLRKLLRDSADGGSQWRRQHPPNAAFLDALRAHGFDAEAWLAPYRATHQVHREKWTVRLEQSFRDVPQRR
jgi:hypothetical protein